MSEQLIIQFPLHDASADVFDQLLMIEHELDLVLRNEHSVNRHEMGASEMNIFIQTNDADAAFKLIKNKLPEKVLQTAVVAYKDSQSAVYSVLWPENYPHKFYINPL